MRVSTIRRSITTSIAQVDDAYHWHLELIPKLSTAAGFELGTGIWINVVKPEDSATFLRERIAKKVGQAA